MPCKWKEPSGALRRADLGIVMILVLFLLGEGCTSASMWQVSKLGDPNQVLREYRTAVDNGVVHTATELWAPEYRWHIRRAVEEGRELQEDLDSLYWIVRERFGPVAADLARGDALTWLSEREQGYFWADGPCRAEPVFADYLDEGRYSVRIGDRSTPLVLVKGTHRWYLTALGMLPSEASAAERMAARYARMYVRRGFDTARTEIARGHVSWDEWWWGKWGRWGMWLDEALARNDQGIKIRIKYLGRPVSVPGRPATFLVGVAGGDSSVRWRLPEGGVGEGMSLIIDGQAMPDSKRVGTRLYGTGSDTRSHWLVMLPEEVEETLSEGVHSLVYVVHPTASSGANGQKDGQHGLTSCLRTPEATFEVLRAHEARGEKASGDKRVGNAPETEESETCD